MVLRCLVIGDPHFKTLEMKASQEMADAILVLAKEKSPDFIVCLGDTLDRHESIHVEPLMSATRWLAQLSEIAKVFLLIGNHDRPNNSDFLSDRHPFVGLEYWPKDRIEIVNVPVSAHYDDHSFFFVPFVPPGRFEEALQTHPEWDPTQDWSAVFSHQEVYGIQLAPGNYSTVGDKWPLTYPFLINGHIHDRHQPQDNILSIGTPRQHDFDESPDKSISLFTFDRKEGKVTMGEDRIKLPIPKKVIIYLSARDVPSWNPPSGKDYLKIEIQGHGGEILALHQSKEIERLRAFGIKVTVRKIIDEKKERKNRPSAIEIPFRDRLYQRVQDEPEVKAIYARLFPRRRITIRR